MFLLFDVIFDVKINGFVIIFLSFIKIKVMDKLENYNCKMMDKIV